MGCQMEFCDKNDCNECCLDVRVPLLNEDINRITLNGYYDVFFVEENNGIKTLRTDDDGTCVFYNKETEDCDINNSKPLRCRLNPYCLGHDEHKTQIDRSCKHSTECQDDPDMHKCMHEFVSTLQDEIDWRRRTGNF